MADDPNDPKDPKGDDTGGGISKEEAATIRAALKTANDEAKAQRLRAKGLEEQIAAASNKDKSEAEKLEQRLVAAERKAHEADDRAMRAEVARDKGLTSGQANRLKGATIEEMSADADDLLEAFKPAAKADVKDGDDPKAGEGKDPAPKAPPTKRPTTNLAGGGDPTADPEETDPRKLAALIPRR